MPFPKYRHLVYETFALKKRVETTAECISVNVQQVLVSPSGMLLRRLDHFEELLLRITITWITLTNVRKLHVKKMLVVRSRNFFRLPLQVFGCACLVGENFGRLQVVDLFDKSLAVLTPPSSITREAAGRGTSPIHLWMFLVPIVVIALPVSDLFRPIPR